MTVVRLIIPCGGIVKLTDCRLFSAFLHETKPLKLRKVGELYP